MDMGTFALPLYSCYNSNSEGGVGTVPDAVMEVTGPWAGFQRPGV